MQADVIVHHLGHSRYDIESDALLVQVVLHILGIGHNLIDGVDDAIAHVELAFGLGYRHLDTCLVGVATDFVISTFASVVNLGETVDEDAIALCTLQELHQSALAHAGVVLILHHGGLLQL